MERDYKELKGCEICFKAFSLTRVRHKCKRCKLIICSDCGKTKSIIIGYKQAPAVPHRVCTICREDINGQEDIRRRFGTSWGTLSSLAIEWLNKCHVLKELNLKGNHNYKKYLEESHSENDVRTIVNDLTDELSQGRADRESFNYSLTEFLYYSQQGKDKDSVRKNVENVLRAFYARHPELGQNTLLINVVVLLLCFADEETAFYLLCYLKEKLLPENYWDLFSSPLPYVGLLKEKYIIQKTAHHILNADFPRPNMKHFEIVFNKVANVLLGGLLVDVVNFKTQFYVWNEMFTQNSILPLELGALKVLKHSKKYYEQFHKMTLYNFRIYVCRTIQEDTLRNDPLELTEETKRRESEEFDNNVLTQSLLNKERLVHALQVLKSISPQDVSLVMDRIRRQIQDVRNQKKSNLTSVELSEADFLSIFNNLESLQQLGENDFVSVYQAIDIEKEGAVSSRVLAGLIILLVSDDLGTKLTDVFSLFDNNNNITQKEVPQMIAFLSEVLPVMNEINSGYLNFHVHLYEMLEKLKKKVKKMDKITPLDFQKVVSRYPVFQVVTGEKKNFGRSSSMLSYVSMTTGQDDNSSQQSDKEPLNEQDFENILDEQVVEKIIDRDHEEAERRGEEERKIYSENDSPVQISSSEEPKQSESTSVIDNSPSISPELHHHHHHHHREEQGEIGLTPVEVEVKQEPVVIGSRFGIQLMAPPPVLFAEKIQEEEREVKQLIQESHLHDGVNNHYHVEVHSPISSAHEEEAPQNYASEARQIEEEAEQIAQVVEEVQEVIQELQIPNPFGKALLDLPTENTYITEENVFRQEEVQDYEVIKGADERLEENVVDYNVASYGGVVVEEIVKEKTFETNEEGVIVEVIARDESYIAKRNTADDTEVDIEQSEFYNEPKIKQQINAAERKIVNRDTSSALEKDNGCKLCNMF